MPRIRKALLGTMCLVFLAFLAVCFIGFDGEALKERIVAEAQAKTGRALEIKGALRLKILPRLAVEINDARLSGPNGEGEFLQIGQLRGALEILPLLGGRISVNQVEARDFALFAERNADGSTNFDDLFSKDEESDQKPLDLAIGKLALLGGRLSWHEVASGQRFLLEDVYLRSDAMGLAAEGGLEMGGKIASAPLEGMALKLDARYRIDGATKTLRLDAPRLSSKAPGEEKAKLDWSARQVVVDWGALALSMSGLKLEGHYAGRLAAVLELDEFTWRQEGGSAQGGALRLAWRPEESGKKDPDFSLEAKLGALTGAGGNWQGDALEATFAGKWQESNLSGRLVLPFVLQRRDDGGMRLGVEAFTVEAKAAGGRLKEALDTRLQGNFAILLPEGASSGKWQISQADSRLDFAWQTTLPLRLSFQASLNQLDVDRYWDMGAQSAREEEADKTGAEEASSSGPAFAGEVEGILRIGELRVNGIRIENLESRIVWTGGKLIVTAPLGENQDLPGEGAGQKDSGQKDVARVLRNGG
ncbi:MAG: AsmA family protein [Betaproteobacteria bacterium]|nr:AsmA family protein [Betaproteobacteria bacterium]